MYTLVLRAESSPALRQQPQEIVVDQRHSGGFPNHAGSLSFGGVVSEQLASHYA
jgi:hypothetical protein